MSMIPSTLSGYPNGTIYLNPDQRVNVYKYGEEIHSLYKAFNNLDSEITRTQHTLDDIERMKLDLGARIQKLEDEVMKMSLDVLDSKNNT